jgi:hypothetical protein
MNKAPTAAFSDRVDYGRKRIGIKKAFWIMICGIVTATFSALMLWYSVVSRNTFATVLREHDGISALLKLLIFGIGLMVISRWMRNSDTSQFPKLTLTFEELIFQDSNRKIVHDRWENFGPFKFANGYAARRSCTIESVRTDDEHQPYQAALYMNILYLDVDPELLLQEMNYRRKRALGIDLGGNRETHVSSVERNMLIMKMLN